MNTLLSKLDKNWTRVSNFINRFSALVFTAAAICLTFKNPYMGYTMLKVVKKYLWPLAQMDMNNPDLDSLKGLLPEMIQDILSLFC